MIITAMEARELATGRKSIVIKKICEQVEQEALKGKTKTYFKTTGDKEALAKAMQKLGFSSWATAQSVAIQW